MYGFGEKLGGRMGERWSRMVMGCPGPLEIVRGNQGCLSMLQESYKHSSNQVICILQFVAAF